MRIRLFIYSSGRLEKNKKIRLHGQIHFRQCIEENIRLENFLELNMSFLGSFEFLKKLIFNNILILIRVK